MHSATLHLDPCWQSCPQSHLVSLNVKPGARILTWPKLHSHKEHVKPFQMHACKPLSLGTVYQPSQNQCHFKWDCPVSSPVIILSWFLLWLSNSQSFFHRGFFLRKPLACLCPCVDCQCSSCFTVVQSMITSLATFAVIPSAGSGSMSGCDVTGTWKQLSLRGSNLLVFVSPNNSPVFLELLVCPGANKVDLCKSEIFKNLQDTFLWKVLWSLSTVTWFWLLNEQILCGNYHHLFLLSFFNSIFTNPPSSSKNQYLYQSINSAI